MQNQKYQETQTISDAFGKTVKLTNPYRRHDGRMDHCLLRQEVEFANRALKHAVKRGMLLDLCCGTGEVSPMLQTPGFRSVGLDINLLALAAFRQHSQDVPLVQGDALQLPFGDGNLDAIVAIHCFDLVDRVGFLQECNRVLYRQGLLIFDALNRHSYKLILKRLGLLLGPQFAKRLDKKWIKVFSYREVLQLVDLAGFDLQATRGYGWPPFSVSSNSRLVNASVGVERALRLYRFPRVSPRIIVAVRKKA
jgi:ubiquinone/menaquinone biosynthesis C-methylase UbiE